MLIGGGTQLIDLIDVVLTTESIAHAVVCIVVDLSEVCPCAIIQILCLIQISPGTC